MSTNPTHKKRSGRTDPRPKTILLGVDNDGARHHYRTRSETIHVVSAAGQRPFVFDVEHEAAVRGQSRRETLADYMDHVTAARGWAERGYATTTIAEEFIKRLEADQ